MILKITLVSLYYLVILRDQKSVAIVFNNSVIIMVFIYLSHLFNCSEITLAINYLIVTERLLVLLEDKYAIIKFRLVYGFYFLYLTFNTEQIKILWISFLVLIWTRNQLPVVKFQAQRQQIFKGALPWNSYFRLEESQGETILSAVLFHKFLLVLPFIKHNWYNSSRIIRYQRTAEFNFADFTNQKNFSTRYRVKRCLQLTLGILLITVLLPAILSLNFCKTIGNSTLILHTLLVNLLSSLVFQSVMIMN